MKKYEKGIKENKVLVLSDGGVRRTLRSDEPMGIVLSGLLRL